MIYLTSYMTYIRRSPRAQFLRDDGQDAYRMRLCEAYTYRGIFMYTHVYTFITLPIPR